MNLLEVRAKFIEISGRADLVVDETDYVDNGADFYINAGQRYLDRLDTTIQSVGKVYKSLAADDWYATFTECRAVKNVYITTDEYRHGLTKKEYGWMLLNYNEPIADIDTGTPTYYSPMILRDVPQNLGGITLSRFVGETIQITDHTHFGYNGIIWMPPCDEAMILEVQGLFYTEKLTVDNDKSSWSVNDPILLVMAACHELEVMYRNTAGANDWDIAIRKRVAGMGMDYVEEEIADVTTMGD